jgi:predicted transposase/invertase (TIGR01784 family)
MTHIHDTGYSVLFSNKVIFRQLLETFVKEPWVSDIDFNEIEKLNKSFISEEHRKRESDLIYKVKLKDKTAYIVVLIEFQSTMQRFMAVRVLHYMMSLYLDLMQQKDLKLLPPIFPIVLYNGDDKWTAPVELKSLIEHYELLGEFGVNFKYFQSLYKNSIYN